MNWKLLDLIGGLIIWVVVWWLINKYVGDGEIGLWEIFLLMVGLMVVIGMFNKA